MKNEMQFILQRAKETWEGNPWFGTCGNKLIAGINENNAFEKPSGQHSILELVWHMVNWKEFVISRLRHDEENVKEFEKNDWRELNYEDKTVLKKGIERLQKANQELRQLLQQQNDELGDKPVEGRTYNFRDLLYGINEHDIYHLGQIAYIIKML